MANFLISSRTRRSRSRTTRRTEKRPDSELGQCKKHPKHRQSPGVCSLCLNEKLSKLSLDHYHYDHKSSRVPETTSSCSSSVSSSSVSSSYYSSASSCLSPLHHRYSEVVAKKKGSKKQGFLFRLLLG